MNRDPVRILRPWVLTFIINMNSIYGILKKTMGSKVLTVRLFKKVWQILVLRSFRIFNLV